jgi:macrolide-specific efflux system membrane fusion protein
MRNGYHRSELLKRCLFCLGLSTVVVVTAFLLASCSTSNPAPSDEEPTPTPLPTLAALAKPTYAVQRGDVVETVHMIGRIAPVNQQPLFFTIDGRIRSVSVKEGDTLQTGEVIADLEGAADLQRQLDMSQIRLQRSQINAEIAQLNFDLFVAQTSQTSVAYDKRLAIEQHKLTLAQLDIQENSLGIQELRDSLSQTQLISPMDGQVTSLQLSAGSQVHAYNLIGTVADVTRLEVSASGADSSLVDQLEVGMAATLTPASGLGKPVTGSVRRLPLSGGDGQPLEPDRSIRISLDTSPTDAGYTLDDLVSLTIIVAQRKDVLWIPPQTIRTFGGRKFVVVQDGDVQRRVDVKLGILGEDRAEVVAGLTEGQVVVSP